MECARCHSHKYDPIPQRDYYRFSAIFQTAYDLYDWLLPNEQLEGEKYGVILPKRYLPHVPEAERREVEAYNVPIQEDIKRLEGSLEDKVRPYREKLLEEKLGKLPRTYGKIFGQPWRRRPGSGVRCRSIWWRISRDRSR